MARAEEELVRTEQQEIIDVAEVQVQLEDINQLQIELRQWENDILSVCSDENYDEYARDCNAMMTRLKNVKTTLVRFTNAMTPQPAVPNVPLRRGVKLPKLDLPKFSGNMLEWTSFRDRFVAAVHDDPTIPNCEKLSYLLSSLTDDAARVLRAMQVTDENYNEAWAILTKKYQNVREIAFTHAERLMGFPSMKEESAKNLTALVDLANETVRSLRILQVEHDKCDLFFDVIVLQKVDSETRKQWHLTLKDDAIPKFQDLLEFLDIRARALSVADKNRPKDNVSKQYSYNVKQAYVGMQMPCPCCHGHHTLDRCEQFLAMDVQARRDFVTRKSLCFKCMLLGHNAKICTDQSSCQTCNKRHHTLLHMDEMAAALATDMMG